MEVYLNDNEERARGPNLMDFDVAREKGLIQKFNPLPAYFDHLRTLINSDVIAENPQRFVVDFNVWLGPRCDQSLPAGDRL